MGLCFVWRERLIQGVFRTKQKGALLTWLILQTIPGKITYIRILHKKRGAILLVTRDGTDASESVVFTG